MFRRTLLRQRCRRLRPRCGKSRSDTSPRRAAGSWEAPHPPLPHPASAEGPHLSASSPPAQTALLRAAGERAGTAAGPATAILRCLILTALGKPTARDSSAHSRFHSFRAGQRILPEDRRLPSLRARIKHQARLCLAFPR